MRFNSSILIFIAIISALILSCRRDLVFSDNPSDKLAFSNSEIVFDTVFTTRSSVTKRFLIFNRNDEALKIERIELMGGKISFYRMNIDGSPGHQLKDLTIQANDSLFGFVEVTIDPNNINNPFVVRDSIRFVTNGNQQFLKLKAWGRNADIYNSSYIRGNRVWTADTPRLIVDFLIVDSNATLTIEPGTEIYGTGNSGLFVFGSLQVNYRNNQFINGERVHFSGDRVDEFYENDAGQWFGIRLLPSSRNNVINRAFIEEATVAITVDSLSNNNRPKLLLTNTLIKNSGVAALRGFTAEILSINSIFNESCGNLFTGQLGGDYSFFHCTFSNISCDCSPSDAAILLANNDFEDQSGNVIEQDLKATFVNNIIYGNSAEEFAIVDAGGGNIDSISIFNNLITTEADYPEETDNILNQDPELLNPCIENYLPAEGSPVLESGLSLEEITQGQPSLLDSDFEGKFRDRDKPDMGAIER